MATVTSLSGNYNTLNKEYDELHGALTLDDGTMKTFTLQGGGDRTEEFDSIVKGIDEGVSNAELAELILKASDKIGIVESRISSNLESIGFDDRLTRSGNRIFVDGEPIDPVLEREILSILNHESASSEDDNSRNWKSLLMFVKDLYSNSNEYVRGQLFSWLKANFESSSKGFTLLDDGRIVGYKGVARTDDGTPQSSYTGLGLVKEKGETEFHEVNGHIPNKIGSTISMPRSLVTNDPNIGCAPGLHIGTWDYAYSWGNGYVLTVAFSASDVVSVPVDSGFKKLRVCKYEVLNVTETPHHDISLDYDDDDDEYDDGED